MEIILEITKFHSVCLTSNNILLNIDMPLVVSKTVNDVDAVAAYKSILFESELIIDNTAKDVFHDIVHLYVTVRSFSLAKDVIQRHKIKSKVLKSKALCKDLSRSS